MKTINILCLTVLFASLLSCNEQNSIGLESTDSALKNGNTEIITKEIQNYTGEVSDCGLATYDLKAGRTGIDAGDVIISYDDDNIYIEVTSTAGFQETSENIKIWLGKDLNDLPTAGNGAPINGHFPYKAIVTENTHIFQIALSEIDGGLTCDDELYVVVHCDVLAESNGQISSETAYSGNHEGEGKRWWWYMKEIVKCCDANDDSNDDNSEPEF